MALGKQSRAMVCVRVRYNPENIAEIEIVGHKRYPPAEKFT